VSSVTVLSPTVAVASNNPRSTIAASGEIAAWMPLRTRISASEGHWLIEHLRSAPSPVRGVRHRCRCQVPVSSRAWRSPGELDFCRHESDVRWECAAVGGGSRGGESGNSYKLLSEHPVAWDRAVRDSHDARRNKPWVCGVRVCFTILCARDCSSLAVSQSALSPCSRGLLAC
jgi:hypothetical protein